MRIGVRELRCGEGHALQRMLRRGTDPISYKRALVVLTSAQGSSIGEIASRQLLSREYVRRIIHRFNSDGVASLRRGYERGGRDKEIAPEVRSLIAEYAIIPPRVVGCPFTRWSLRKLRAFLIRREVVKTIGLETLRRIFAEYGVSFQRLKTWKESKDPDFVVKKTASGLSLALSRKASE
jgi:transposase